LRYEKMGRTKKAVDLVLDTYGSFQEWKKGCIILRDRNGKTEKYPLIQEEVGEVVLKSGNMISTGLLDSSFPHTSELR